MDLLSKFKDHEVKGLHLCTGGERAATSVSAANASPSGCTKDSQEVSQTPIPGQPEGTSDRDYSDWLWECGISPSIGGVGIGVGTGVTPS